MSTRSIIARTREQEGHFAGRYVHSDGMPTSMGAFLWSLLRSHFQNDLGKMLAYLIDAPHAVCGWSAIFDKDFNLRPGYTWQKAAEKGGGFDVYSKTDDYRRPQCFSGRKGEEAWLLTEKDLGNTDCEWLYVFDETNQKLFVRDISEKDDVGVIDLTGAEPNWSVIECGENFERCKHYAWVHNLAPKDCNLSTQTWLGNRPLEFRDAVAFIIGGKRWESTGSGGHSNFYNRFNTQRWANQRTGKRPVLYPSNCWIANVKAKNGKRKDVPVAKIVGDQYQPIPGIAWVYPATKNTAEVVVGQ